MKAISIKQPWAAAIMSGLKRVENRTWATNYRGPLLIHAPLKDDPGAEEIVTSRGVEIPQDIARGAIVGIVDLVDVVRLDSPGEASRALADDPWANGPVCWILENSRPLPEPIPYKGQQGLFNVPDDVLEIDVSHHREHGDHGEGKT